MATSDFIDEVIAATTGPMDTGLRSYARTTAEYVEQHAPAGPGQEPQQARSSGYGYASPGRGVSGESVN